MNDSALLKLDSEHVMLAGIKKHALKNTDEFMRRIRTINNRVAVQAVNADFVADKEHVIRILQQSLQAKKRGTMLSKRIEIDILLRLACTSQISKALDDIGLKEGMNNILVIGIGKVSDLNLVRKQLAKNYKLNGSVLKLSTKKMKMLYSRHKIDSRETKVCISDNKLGSILAERANLLW